MARRRKLVRRDNYQLLTCDMGQLVPIGLMEMLPNETIRHRTSAVIRVSPLAAPVMHPVTARIHHFFVPSRVLWPQEVGGTEGDNWEDFVTGGPNGDNAATPPQITTTGASNDLLDYLGIPPKAGISISALPVRAFNMIFNEWYRDQDLVTEREMLDLTIPLVSWAKDYFTAARPWTQKGPDVTIPIGTEARVAHKGSNGTNVSVYSDGASADRVLWQEGAAGNVKQGSTVGNYTNEGLYVDLAAATGADVNDVRRAFALQRYQENMARYGSRFVEYLQRSFGARPLDARLQRPELLGGGQTQVNFSEILQTAPDDSGDPRYGVGDLYGHGIAAMRSNAYQRNIPEHGYVITCLSVRPHSIYTDGIDRHWLKTKKEEFFQPELKAIGQQEVLNNEVFADGTDGGNVFGYQDRYSEYRHQRSNVHAEFRNVLDYWHMGRKFAQPPVLNASFVECDATKRIHNEQTQHALWIMVQHRARVLSPVGRNVSPRIL